jgi:exopolysaccharide production protein ExoZ
MIAESSAPLRAQAPVRQPRIFPLVQGLRAVAAGAVAFAHVAHDAVTAGRDPNGLIAGAEGWLSWGAGVDIFFVISGFVIVHASANLFGRQGATTRFLRRRLTRIVPLYWALTTLFLAMELLNTSAVHAEIGGGGYILASYLFFPFPRPDGLVQPALGLGWTLNYEMFFYCLLSPFLRYRREAAVAGCAISLCVVVAGEYFGNVGATALQFWANPIVLEFVLGMAIAVAVARGLSLPGWARLVLAVLAVGYMHVQGDLPFNARVLTFGIPGAMLVVAAVSGVRAESDSRAMRYLVRLGDASYAMYLFHPFVMRTATLLGERLGAHSEASGITIVVLSLVVAQACALLINMIFERRVTALLRGSQAALA